MFPFSRRQFLKAATSTAGAMLIPSSLARASLLLPQKILGEKCLNLYNTHTGEFFKGPYWAKGVYLSEALEKLNFLLRDHRTGEKKAMLPELLDLIQCLQAKLGYPKTIDVISGFRSPATNQLLCKKSKSVAKKSLHMQGAAIDLRFKGIRLAQAYKAACSFQAGGVGHYPRSRFIHIDVRPRVVHWMG